MLIDKDLRSITIDKSVNARLVEESKLRHVNISSLINSLIKEYFKRKDEVQYE